MSRNSARRIPRTQPTAQFAKPRACDLTDREVIQLGSEVLAAEARALANVLARMNGDVGRRFAHAVHLLHDVSGSLMITGMGKAGLIGKKLAATFASTGTRAHFLHPAEAIHGDLGRVQPDDVVLVLSQSGETDEIVQLLPSLQKLGVPLLAITASVNSTLGKVANVTIELGRINEACWLGLAPTTSTTAMLAIGDALALVNSRLHGFQAEDFARNHPGGSLGRQLSHVEDHMRRLDQCRIAPADHTVRQVLVTCTRPGRRTGAIMLTDAEGILVGLFTDSDLARLIENRKDAALDRPVSELMIRHPQTVLDGCKISVAIEMLVGNKISELPVVNETGKPVGLIDVTDIVSLLPEPNVEPDHPPTVRIFPTTE